MGKLRLEGPILRFQELVAQPILDPQLPPPLPIDSLLNAGCGHGWEGLGAPDSQRGLPEVPRFSLAVLAGGWGVWTWWPLCGMKTHLSTAAWHEDTLEHSCQQT